MRFDKNAVREFDQVIMGDFIPEFSEISPFVRRFDNSTFLCPRQTIQHGAFISEFDLVECAKEALGYEVAQTGESRGQGFTGFSLLDR